MSTYQTLTPAQVAERLAQPNEIFVVDVREPRSFHARHIPDAILLTADDFADRYHKEIDPGDEVILVCERGQTSEAAAKFLAEQGFTHVATMAGGMTAYTGPTEATR